MTNNRVSKANCFSYIILQRPGAAHRTRKPTIGGFVVDETLRFRVPFELLLKPYSYITDLTNYVRLHSDINGTYRIVPGFDTIQQVPYVIAAPVEVNIVCSEFGVQ